MQRAKGDKCVKQQKCESEKYENLQSLHQENIELYTKKQLKTLSPFFKTSTKVIVHPFEVKLKDLAGGSIGYSSIAAATPVHSAVETVNTQVVHGGSNRSSVIAAVPGHSAGENVGVQVVDNQSDSDQVNRH